MEYVCEECRWYFHDARAMRPVWGVCVAHYDQTERDGFACEPQAARGTDPGCVSWEGAEDAD